MRGGTKKMKDGERESLWSLLRGHGYLWHRTSLAALSGILTDQEIIPNTGQFPTTTGQSEVGYARRMGGVSLFDFDTASEQDFLDHRYDYCRGDVLIRIRRAALDSAKLLSPSRLRTLPDEIRVGGIYVPYIEALHIGPIPETAFDSFVLAPINGGEHLWYKTTPDAAGLNELLEISAELRAGAE
jgi:hypothetical protein